MAAAEVGNEDCALAMPLGPDAATFQFLGSSLKTTRNGRSSKLFVLVWPAKRALISAQGCAQTETVHAASNASSFT